MTYPAPKTDPWDRAATVVFFLFGAFLCLAFAVPWAVGMATIIKYLWGFQ